MTLSVANMLSGPHATSFLHMVESYVDDFIQLVQSPNSRVLRHCSCTLLHAVHSVFPSPPSTGHNGQDPISLKKLLEGDGVWEVRKEVLGWVFDRTTRCIKLVEKKQKFVTGELKTIAQMTGVSFKRFEKLNGKL